MRLRRAWIVLIVLGLFALMITPAMAQVSISPVLVDKSISDDYYVSIRITNENPASLDVTVEKSSSISSWVDVSPESITIPANSSANVTLHLKPNTYSGRLYYFWTYTHNNVTHQGVIEQPVSVTVVYKDVEVYPKTIREDVIKGELKTVYVILTNKNAVDVDVSVDWKGDVIKDVSDYTFTIEADSSKTLEVKLNGVDGRGTITYEFEYPDEERKYEQDVYVYTYESAHVKDLEEQIDQLKKENQDLKSQIDQLKKENQDLKFMGELPSEIKIENDKAYANKEFRVKVSGKKGNSWIALDKVPVGFEDYVKFTDSSGVVYFTPKTAGQHSIKVYDRFGNIKREKIIEVQKSNITLNLPDFSVGKKAIITLPEPGTVTIYRDGHKIVTLEGRDKYNFTVDMPGDYDVVYSSPSYVGKGSFMAKGKVRISATINGVQVKSGAKVPPGSTIQIGFVYASGKPAKGVVAEISMPATAYGIDEKWAVLFALFSSNQRFSPPYNIVTTKEVDGSMTLVIPEKASGVLRIKLQSDDYITSDEFTLFIEPKGIDWFYYIGLSALSGFIIFMAMLYKDYRGIKTKLKKIRRRKKGYGPPT
ncbi:hypothetical protein DRP07_00285 [Archaeoglobales archaeon]|nr:MAG: hypothetical protein DRP07_00285 [Archaeoglobales archaeon]